MSLFSIASFAHLLYLFVGFAGFRVDLASVLPSPSLFVLKTSTTVDKKSLSERDICTKLITPSIVKAGWDLQAQVREEVNFTKGRVIVRGRMVKRGTPKRADYILYFKPNIPIAVIEAKDNNHSVGAGMQQGLGYADTLDIPFAYSSNGDAFLEHDRTSASGKLESDVPLDSFPSPTELWQRYLRRGTSMQQQRTPWPRTSIRMESARPPTTSNRLPLTEPLKLLRREGNAILR